MSLPDDQTPDRIAHRTLASEQVDKYDAMLALADAFDAVGEELRARAGLGGEILRDPAVADSAPLSIGTHGRFEDALRAATTGKAGLLGRSIELDADALVVRATVRTYRWLDELRQAAYSTLGSIAGRAIGYLAPEVALGGAIVTAGLIETDALDRDEVAGFLGELAAGHPELMEHVAGGGLLESLQLRALLTPGMPQDDEAHLVASAGLRAMDLAPFPGDLGAALRDVAGELVDDAATTSASVETGHQAPRGLAELMAALESVTTSVTVRPAAPGRYIAYLPGPSRARSGGHLRLVSGDLAAYAEEAAQAIEAAVEPGAKVMLVGSAAGGATAAELAAQRPEAFEVEQVVTAGSPAAHVPRIPDSTRMLSLEDRSDPVALLGSLVNATDERRVTVVFDADGAAEAESRYVAGGRAADSAAADGTPELRAEIDRLRELGYLS